MKTSSAAEKLINHYVEENEHFPGADLNRPGQRYDWNQVRDKLGRLPDNQIASLLGCSRERVRQKRVKLGIPLPKVTKQRKNAGSRLLTEFRDQLGKVHDRELARLANCSHGTVWRIRNKLGIPPAGKSQSQPVWMSDYGHFLGFLSDREIARRAGVSPGVVLNQRRRLGIPPANSSRSNGRN